jgi:hypothetical protein
MRGHLGENCPMGASIEWQRVLPRNNREAIVFTKSCV